MGIYLTSGLGICTSLDIERIRKRLSRLPLVPVLNVLAQIAYQLDKAKTLDNEVLLAKQILKPKQAKKAILLLRADKRYHIMSSHVVSLLALNALIHCRDGDEDASIDLTDIGKLLFALGEIVNASAKNMSLDDALVELVRTELWFQRNDFDRWYELACRLIFEVLPQLKAEGSKKWLDSKALSEQATGIDLETFWAITLAAGLSVEKRSKWILVSTVRQGWIPQQRNI